MLAKAVVNLTRAVPADFSQDQPSDKVLIVCCNSKLYFGVLKKQQLIFVSNPNTKST